MSEYELGAAIEAAWLPHGATTHIHYLAATPMAAPELCVPAQWPSDRRLEAGDALVFEVSANFWEYPAQRLGTIFVDAEPTPLYRELLDTAQADVRRGGGAAAGGRDRRRAVGGGGRHHDPRRPRARVRRRLPSARARRPHSPIPDFTFEAGMTVVVQPNVVTPDERAGVQVGELLLVTDDGVERLHG